MLETINLKCYMVYMSYNINFNGLGCSGSYCEMLLLIFLPPHSPLPLPTWNLFPWPRAYILDSRIQSEPLSTKSTMQSMEGMWTLFPLYSCPAITIHPCLQYEPHIHVTKSGESLVRISSNN